MNDTTGHRQLSVFCILIGAAGLWIAQGYDAGNVIAMGPGFFPRAISGLLILMGIVILLGGGRDVEPDEQEGAPLWVTARIILCVIGSLILFGLALRPLGLAVAVFLMVLLASAAPSGARVGRSLLTAVALSAFAVLVFAYLLGLSIPVFPKGLL